MLKLTCGCRFPPRSTLDPALRMERRLFPDPRGLALLGSGVLYLLATPGVLAGFIDTYILAPLQRVTAPVYGPVRMPVEARVCTAIHRQVCSGPANVIRCQEHIAVVGCIASATEGQHIWLLTPCQTI